MFKDRMVVCAVVYEPVTPVFPVLPLLRGKKWPIYSASALRLAVNYRNYPGFPSRSSFDRRPAISLSRAQGQALAPDQPNLIVPTLTISPGFADDFQISSALCSTVGSRFGLRNQCNASFGLRCPNCFGNYRDSP
jgi:hypothetical protein